MASAPVVVPERKCVGNSIPGSFLFGPLDMLYSTAVGPAVRGMGSVVRKGIAVTMAVAMPFVLGGCMAAVVPMIAAEVATLGFAGFKLIQTTTGGSFEIAVDVTKLSSEQKAQIKGIKSLAVWPEWRGGSVSLAEALAEAKTFSVVPPARVASALKKLDLSGDLKAMTTAEVADTFTKVCDATGADAVIFTKATGVTRNINTWSFERGNITMEFLTSFYAKGRNGYIASIPVTIKVLIGEAKQPTDEEISDAANAELAKNILALAR